MAATATRVIGQAVSILEDEIAAGIMAAKHVEQRFLDVDELRDEDRAQLVQRFRRDAHEVIDILLDLANAAVTSTGDLARRAVRLRTAEAAPRSAGAPEASDGVPMLTLPGPVAAGTQAQTAMSVDNDAAEPITGFGFTATDLLGAGQERVAADHVVFDPAEVTIAPQGSTRVAVTVAVPDGTPSGVYSGLLQAEQMPAVRAVLVVEVA